MALIESAVVGFFAVCVAFVVGVVIGWAWKPKWGRFGSKAKRRCLVPKSFYFSLPSSPARSVNSPLKSFGSAPCLTALASDALTMAAKQETTVLPAVAASSEPEDVRIVRSDEKLSNTVTEEDLRHLVLLLELKDGGPAWMHMMDRSTSGMLYQAWWREPKIGPTQYRSRTVFEDATPEMVRDFFWDDEFRPKWDNMLAGSTTLEECPNTGTMIVRWIRKFPFFCGDREYIIGRRIWECGRSYYCVTKGVSLSSVPPSNKPRRVELFYSSWCIRAVESRRGNVQTSACEVLLFHHEDMGIPRELAKLGVRHGMWGAVKKMEPGFRAYQKERSSSGAKQLSRSAITAQINTSITLQYLSSLGTDETSSPATEVTVATSHEQQGFDLPKALILGGAVVLACSLNSGLLPKAFLFGIGRRFGNVGRRTSDRINNQGNLI